VSAAGTRRTLLWALFLVALGGFLLHYRIHPYVVPDKEHAGQMLFRGSFLAASLLPVLDLVVVTTLFARRSTAPLGYLLNGILVIYGTVLMSHFSIAMLAPKALTPADWLLKSTFPDIAIAAGDFLIGRALYESWMREE
jgi:hypothetical protein